MGSGIWMVGWQDMFALGLPWVEKIFEKLGVTYGRDFLARWDGFDADAMAAVKYDWCMELGGFFD